MTSLVTLKTKRDTVRRSISKLWVWPPRFKVMDLQCFRIAISAILACPVVSTKNSLSKSLVPWIGEIGRSCQTMTASPVWMTWSDQMAVARRSRSYSFAACPDSSLMFFCERSSGKRFGYLADCSLSRLRSHELLLTICLFGLRRNLGSNIRPFGDIYSVDSDKSCDMNCRKTEDHAQHTLYYTVYRFS